MPVFAQICSADPVVTFDDGGMIAVSTCNCGADIGAAIGGDSVIESADDYTNSNHSTTNVSSRFIHIDGIRHSTTCAFALSATNSFNFNLNTLTLTPAQRSILILKQQQQQLIAGLALLRKQQQPLVPGGATTRNGALGATRQQVRREKKDPFDAVRLMPSRISHLYAGSRFQGRQKSGSNSYEVMVDIKDVNLKDSSLCGYLHIKGLTDEYPELTTFFDAEIIGSAHSFVTKKWDASAKTDKEHWTLFKPFEPMCDIFTNDDFKYDFQGKDVIFMRWKEHFLVPDHRVEGITGASFAGFYYICYNISKGEIEGYYYHQSSEKFQKLMLSHVQERPTSFGSFEFR
ncbi:hypothetical protein BGZ95_009247 [Linnemannia exigua]|uniref:Vacuolar import and degradation protein n=1 Tax=Linnemannia exigua TaxID=604196 RepID=A0AAD4DD54_9FUNG|nr:hypothetical protein BGZ95_009247 [Linnemannia exigua]